MSASNGTSPKGGDIVQFNVGLINAKSKKYLTAELGNVNMNGTSLKSKQVWTLQPAGGDKLFYLSNTVAKFDRITIYRLTYNQKTGDLTAEKVDEDASPDLQQKFWLEPQGDGKFAIKAEKLGYLSGSGELPKCQSKTIGLEQTWSIQLATHPQVNICGIQTGRFAHLDLNADAILFKEEIPWGAEAVMTLMWDAAASQYLIQASDDRFVNADGTLSATKSGDSLYALEFQGENIAFKNGGKYLSIGGGGELKARKGTAGTEAQFRLEDSYPQGVFYSVERNKFIAKVQGEAQLAANQEDEEKSEIFQLECGVGKTNEWAIRGKGGYWTMDSKQAIHTKGTSKADACLFEFIYSEEVGTMALRAKSNGKYLNAKGKAPLAASSSEVGNDETFRFKLTNRPNLVLKGEHGFIGLRKMVECNRTMVDNEVIQVSYENDGTYIFRSSDPNTAWTADDQGNYVLSEGTPEKFTLEFMKRSHFLIRASNGKLLEGKQHGELRATGTEMKKSTLWEF